MQTDISDDGSLAELSWVLKTQPFFALDTEFIGERTYWAKLALVQVSYPGIRAILIDPLCINNWEPFHAVLRDPDIIKVFHSGRQDVEIFCHQMGQAPRNVYDTQVAASLCGYGAQIGYGDLVMRIVGCRLDKNDTYSDWLQRPLTSDQLAYARNDVRFLCRIYEVLRDRLADLNRTSWVEAEMAERFAPEIFIVDPDKQWLKVRRHKSLAQQDRVVMKDLAAWRLSQAQSLDRPIRSVLSDEALVEASRTPELELDHLKGRRAFSRFPVGKLGPELVRVHSLARKKPKNQWPELNKSKRSTSRQLDLLADLAWVIVQTVAHRHRIAPSKIINKRELASLIEEISKLHSEGSPKTIKGWRWDLIGPPLRGLVSGELDVGVRDGTVAWNRCDPS